MTSENNRKTGAVDGPAYYAVGRQNWWRDVRAILHPPYTIWHLSYVIIGSLIGPTVNWRTLGAAVLAFFLAVGIAAHALDELRGRPLETTVSAPLLITAATIGLIGAISIGIVGAFQLGPWFVVFIIVGTTLVLGYNLELFDGRFHTDLGFALAWGAFPVLTAAFAQDRSLRVSAIVLAVACAFLSTAQRHLSKSARLIRRRAVSVNGQIVFSDGSVKILDHSTLLVPLETTLRCLSWTVVTLAASLLLARLSL